MKNEANRSRILIGMLTMVLAVVLTFQGIGYAQQKSSESGVKAAGSEQQAETNTQRSKTSMQYRSLIGQEVRTKRGEDIGEIDNVVISDDGREIKAVMALGGFLGMSEERVLVSMDQLRVNPDSDYVTYRGTESDLDNLTRYQPVQSQYEPYRTSQRREYDRRSYRERRDSDQRYRMRQERYPPYVSEESLYGRPYEERRPDYRDYDEGYERGYPSREDRYGRGYYERGRESRYSPREYSRDYEREYDPRRYREEQRRPYREEESRYRQRYEEQQQRW